jgi:hypothetical protein
MKTSRIVVKGRASGDYTGLPLNGAARRKADSWDASIQSLREHQVQPMTAIVMDLAQQLEPVPGQIVDEIAGLRREYVPHHLPGANPFLEEFAQQVGLPFEATRGGKETTYPEYQSKLRELLSKMPKRSAQ